MRWWQVECRAWRRARGGAGGLILGLAWMVANAHPAWATLFDITLLSTLQLEEGAALSPPVRPYYVVGDESLAGLTYSITPPLPAGLRLDPANGEISGTPLAAEAGAGRSHRIAISRSGRELYATVIEVAVARRLRAVPGIMPPLVPGQPLAPFRPVVASEGVQPYWYQISPPLPPGLYLDPETGEVSGVPGADADRAGATEYQISVRDLLGVEALASLRFSIGPPASQLVLSVMEPSINLKAGVRLGVTPVVVQGVGPFSFRASWLPPGLSMDPATGEISGMVSNALAPREIDIVVTDQGTGREASATITLSARSADFVVEVPAPVLSLPVETPLLFHPVEVIGVGPFRYRADALPAGLQMDENTGEVRGRIPAVSQSVSVIVIITDTGSGFSQSASFRIQPVLTISAEVRLPEVVLEIDVDVAGLLPVKALAPAGVTVTYAINPSLPANLSFASETGEILGRPLAVMPETSFEISMVAGQGEVVRRRFVLRVVSTFAAADDVAATEYGMSVSIPVTVNDGAGPFDVPGIETVPRHGTVQVIGLNVIYFPDPDFSGTDRFTYRLNGTGGRSAVANVIVTVAQARTWQPPVPAPLDPTTIASAFEAINIQRRANLRFAETQIDNFSARLQDLHRQQPASARLRFTGTTLPEPAGPVRFAGAPLPGDAGWPARTSDLASSPRRAEGRRSVSGGTTPYVSRATQSRRLSFWSGGTLMIGNETRRNRPEMISFGTEGYSGGVDYALDPGLSLGVGLGFADEKMATDSMDLVVLSTSVDGVVYGSWRPGSAFYLDGLIGYGRIRHFITRQPLDEADPAMGERLGLRTFGALYLGHEVWGDIWRLAPFVGLTGVEVTLADFREAGSPNALDYRRESVRSYGARVGLAADLRVRVFWLMIAPRFQAEWRQRLDARHHTDIGWATAPDGPRHISDHVERGTGQLSVSAGVLMENGPFAMSIDWQGVEGDQHARSDAFRISLGVRF